MNVGSAVGAAQRAAIPLFLSACATVSCPEPESAPRAVFLLDHGRHASLVMESADGALHRYSYGDRRWYAEGDTGFGQAFSALFRKTPAVLLRQRFETAPTVDALERLLPVRIENAYPLAADGARVDTLIEELERVHGAGAGDPGPEYAPHPVPYTLGHNSNHVVADWLAALGCNTSGSPMLSRWNVR